jgi:hypothetical protein
MLLGLHDDRARQRCAQLLRLLSGTSTTGAARIRGRRGDRALRRRLLRWWSRPEPGQAVKTPCALFAAARYPVMMHWLPLLRREAVGTPRLFAHCPFPFPDEVVSVVGGATGGATGGTAGDWARGGGRRALMPLRLCNSKPAPAGGAGRRSPMPRRLSMSSLGREGGAAGGAASFGVFDSSLTDT